MNLYEIDKAILACIDGETGEILDAEMLDALQMERDSKVESVALWIKEMAAENAVIKAEKERLDNLAKRNEKRAESLKNWLSGALDHTAFKTVKCAVSFRPSVETVIDDEALLPDAFLKAVTKKTPVKAEIKKAIESGATVPGAHLESKINCSVK